MILYKIVNDVDVENVLVSRKIYAGEESYKYYIGYLHDDNKKRHSI